MANFGFLCFLCLSVALVRAVQPGSDAAPKKQTADEALQQTKTLAREIWQNETARQTISSFLSNFQAVIDGKTSGQLLIVISRLIKDLLKVETSEQNLEIVSNTSVVILTDKEASKNLQTILDNGKTVFSNKNTVALVRAAINFFDDLTNVPRAPVLIETVGEGIQSLMHYDDPRKTIIGAFTNLKVIGGAKGGSVTAPAIAPAAAPGA